MSRASPRYPVRLAATLLVGQARGAAEDMLICRTRNISREGCLLDTSHAIGPGMRVEITIMDDQTGDAISMYGLVARAIDARPGGGSGGIGVRIPEPPAAWLALVERQSKRRPAASADAVGKRQSIVVVGDETRRRGALALYVKSGWDIRFATDFAGAREALSTGQVDALVAEHDLGDERWPPLMELARELRPGARRLVRARLSGRKRPEGGFRDGLVHRFVDQDAGLDALFDALTASFSPQPERDASSLQVKLMSLDRADGAPRLLTSAPTLSTADAAALLARVLQVAGDATPAGILVFDLDSTLIDNRPRQAEIMREYGRDKNLPELARATPDLWKDWDFRAAMSRAGLGEAAIDAHAEAFRAFWFKRFFTSEYCVVDKPIAGAPAYVTAAARTGARVFYVTGRPERMRKGTLKNFASAGFPAPDGDRVQLVMKPSSDEGDDEYKARIYQHLDEVGRVVAAFDNEPAHINGYREAFPDAFCVHLATDHSPRPIRVADGIPSIPDFAAYDGAA